MDFEILSEITEVETIASGKGIRELRRLRKQYGLARWRKRKGFASIMLKDGTIMQAELQRYEAEGVGKREIKIKKLLRDG